MMHWLYRNDSVDLIKEPPVGLEHKYKLDDVIGEGATATVASGVNKSTGEKVAVKVVDKKELAGWSLERLQREVKILQRLKHPNVVKLHDYIETETKIFLILDYCDGGEMLHYVASKERLSETEARMLFRQMVSGVAYCHQMGVCHRDIKLENILLDRSKKAVKIIDFGLARSTTVTKTPTEEQLSDLGPLLSSHVGTLQYAAPELLEGGLYFGHMVDVWSLGIVLYCLTTGRYPFQGTVGDSLVRSIGTGSFPMPTFLSHELKDLISHMLVPDPLKRFTMGQVKSHPWLNKGFTTATGTNFMLSQTDKTTFLPTPGKRQRPRSVNLSEHPHLMITDPAATLKSLEEIVSRPNSNLSYHHMIKRTGTAALTPVTGERFLGDSLKISDPEEGITSSPSSPNVLQLSIPSSFDNPLASSSPTPTSPPVLQLPMPHSPTSSIENLLADLDDLVPSPRPPTPVVILK